MTYVNPASIIAISVAFPVLGALALLARHRARRLRKTSFGTDGVLCVVAWALMTGCSVTLIVAVSLKTVGYHSSIADAGDLRVAQISKIEFTFSLLWIAGITVIKLAFLFFYRRIFRGIVFDIINWSLIAISSLLGIITFFMLLFLCGHHYEHYWTPVLAFRQNHCLDSSALFFGGAFTSAVTDLVVLVLPMPFIWRLQMSLQKKLSASFIFALGAFTVIAGSLHLAMHAGIWASLTQNKTLHLLGMVQGDDFGIVSLTIFWSMIELGVAQITSSLPLLRPLIEELPLKNIVRRVLVSTSKSWKRMRSTDGESAGSSEEKSVESPVRLGVLGEKSVGSPVRLSVLGSEKILIESAGLKSDVMVREGRESGSMSDIV